MFPIRFFEKHDEVLITERRLPHWAQAGTLCFMTWRTWDSMPPSVIAAWIEQRDAWLRRHGIDPGRPGWQAQIERLDASLQIKYRDLVAERWDNRLDACHGICPFRSPALRLIVENSLQHFQGDRYLLTDFVIMPNHVHLIAAFEDPAAMLRQAESWKHFTAVKLNRELRRKGRFWETDGFDHLVRGPDQYDHFRRYLAENPKLANLQPEEYTHFSMKVVDSLRESNRP